MTQEKLAEKINMDITSLSKIETGRNYPQPETVEKIANAFGIEVEQLFMFGKNFTNEDYINAINKNILFIRNNEEKLKILHAISQALI